VVPNWEMSLDLVHVMSTRLIDEAVNIQNCSTHMRQWTFDDLAEAKYDFIWLMRVCSLIRKERFISQLSSRA
jgi:hypothetical protein